MVQELGFLVNKRYKIERLLRQTPSEVLYLVKDQAEYGESCILREFTGSEVAQTKIIQEFFQPQIAKLQCLRHPQVQKIKDFFCDCNILFVVYGYVEGTNYQELLKNGCTLSETKVVELFNQVLPILSYLHQQQIIHGDISPHHIFLRTQDQLAVLTNFGLTEDIREKIEGRKTNTKLVDRVRILSGNNIASGIHEDLYALAVTGVMLLTGQEIETLFNSNTQTWDWENCKLVSDQLTCVLNRMLSLQTSNRFKSVDEVLQALNNPSAAKVPSAIPMVAVPPIPQPPIYQPQPIIYPPNYQPTNSPLPSSSTNWFKPVIVGLVIGLSVVGVGGFAWWRQNSLQQAKQQPTMPPNQGHVARNTSEVQVTTSTSIPGNLTKNTSPPENAISVISNTPTTSPENATKSTNETIQSRTTLSQQDAVALIHKWLAAKRQMFSPPYNRQILSEIATGEQYNSNVAANGTIDWLERNNARYEYGLQKIDSVDRFDSSGNEAVIQVKVTEERKLIKSGRVDPEQSDFKTRVVIYNLRLVDGGWKIAGSKVYD